MIPACRFRTAAARAERPGAKGRLQANHHLLQDRATITGIRDACARAELTEPSKSPANPPRP